MHEQSLLSGLTLSPEAQAIIRDEIASGRHADVSAVTAAALRLLGKLNAADGSKPPPAPRSDLAELRRVVAQLEAAKAERDFIISLIAKQRQVPHPEAISN